MIHIGPKQNKISHLKQTPCSECRAQKYIVHVHQNMVLLGRIMCNLYTTSFLPPRVISSLLPIFLQLSCLARCFIRSENPLNFLRKFANLINDGAKILTLFTTKRKKRRSLEKKLYSVPVFSH